MKYSTEDSPCSDTVRVWITGEDEKGSRFVVSPMQMEFTPLNNSSAAEPSLVFTGHMAMQFFPALHDAMIRSGHLKPKKDQSVEIIQNHLADMRKIVFEHFLKDKEGGNDR